MAHELPWFEIPVLCAGDNPHVDFDFCVTPRNRDEYHFLLLNLDLVKNKTNFNKEGILKFYYLHNLYEDKERISISESYNIIEINTFNDHDFFGQLKILNSDLLSKIEKNYIEIFKRLLS